MSKKRKPREREATRAEISRSPQARPQSEVTTTSPSPLVRWSLPIFLVLLVLYLVLFFTSPEPVLQSSAGNDGQFTRLDMAHWLWTIRLAELPREWTGGDGGNVGIGDRAIVVIAAALVLTLSLVLGWLHLDLTQAARGLTSVETFVFSLGVGLNALSLLVLCIGLTGFLHSYSAYTLPIVLILGMASWRFVRRVSRLPAAESVADSGKRDAYPTPWLRAGALWLGAPFILILIAGALFPPREFDVREYHLQAPKEWFQAGRIEFLPHNVYANMPLGPQILSLPAMAFMPGERAWWWGAMVGKLLLASYAPLTAFALFAAGRRFFSESAGVVAALVYISIPWIAHVSMEGYVDAALACYLFLAVYAVTLADAASDINLRPRRLLLAGFLAGAAVCCKYTGALFVVAPLAAWVLFNRLPRTIDARGAAIFVLTAVLACGPWLGKNWVLTKNPVYPLAYNLFDGATRTPAKDAQWRAAHAVPQNEYGERYSPRQIGQAVANVTFRSEWLSPIVWPLAALGLFAAGRRRNVWMIAGMLIFVFAAWFMFTHRIDRFWLPALPLAALLAGVGATWRSDAWWRRVVFAMLFWGLVWNFILIAGARTPPKLLVAYDTLRRDASLAPLAHVHLNKIVPQGSSVLLVGDAEPFDLEMPAYYNTCFDNCVLEQWMKDKTRDERLDELQRRRLSHVLVNWSEIARYRSPGNYGYSDWPQPKLFQELVRQGVLEKPQRVRSRTSGQVGELYEVVGAP